MWEGHRFSWSLRRCVHCLCDLFISYAAIRFNLWSFLSTCRIDQLSGVSLVDMFGYLRYFIFEPDIKMFPVAKIGLTIKILSGIGATICPSHNRSRISLELPNRDFCVNGQLHVTRKNNTGPIFLLFQLKSVTKCIHSWIMQILWSLWPCHESLLNRPPCPSVPSRKGVSSPDEI